MKAGILLASLGRKAACLQNPGMVYDFDDVSLELFRTMFPKAFKLSDWPSRLNPQPTSRGYHATTISHVLGSMFP